MLLNFFTVPRIKKIHDKVCREPKQVEKHWSKFSFLSLMSFRMLGRLLRTTSAVIKLFYFQLLFSKLRFCFQKLFYKLLKLKKFSDREIKKVKIFQFTEDIKIIWISNSSKFHIALFGHATAYLKYIIQYSLILKFKKKFNSSRKVVHFLNLRIKPTDTLHSTIQPKYKEKKS